MNRLVLIACSLLATSGHALAQSDEGRHVFGQGIVSCGMWTEARRARNAIANLSAQWVAGYLSGLNMASSKPDALTRTDFDGLNGLVGQLLQGEPPRHDQRGRFQAYGGVAEPEARLGSPWLICGYVTAQPSRRVSASMANNQRLT
jgi:hypothetical protein